VDFGDFTLLNGPAMSPSRDWFCGDAGSHYTLTGAAGFIARRPVSYEELLDVCLGDQLDERDVDILLHCKTSLPELAAFRAVVNNYLLNWLQSEFETAGMLDAYAEAANRVAVGKKAFSRRFKNS
jgi:hypothetical protein